MSKIVIDIIKEQGTEEELLILEGSVFLVELQQSFFFRIRRNDNRDQFFLRLMGTTGVQRVWFPPTYSTEEYNNRMFIEFLASNAEYFSTVVN